MISGELKRMLLVLLTTIFASQVAANQLCTNEKLQECYELLIKDDLPSVTIFYFSEEVMTEHCRRYKIFSECIKTIRPYCSESVNSSYLTYEGLDDAYGFVCGDGFKEYVQYQESCFKEDDVQYEANTCNLVLSQRMVYLKTNVTDKKYLRARYCQYMDDFIDCIYNLLLSFCGKPAAKWHQTFYAKSVQPTMVAIGCTGWPIVDKETSADNSAAIWVISLGAAIVVTGAMVAIGLGLLVCSKCRCRRPIIRRSVSADMPPPPYSAPPFIISRIEEPTLPSRSRTPSSGSTDRASSDGRQKPPSSPKRPPPSSLFSTDTTETRRVKGVASVFTTGSREPDLEEGDGAVGGSSPSSALASTSPFMRSYTPTGHFEMPSPGSSILSSFQSSDEDTASLIHHTCDYY